jgi:methionyl-tRNA formyltransferase
MSPSPSPVKRVAQAYQIEVRTPQGLKDPAVWQELAAFEPDAVCVAAYGAILPREVLDIPRLACLNVHASLLPAWRGAAPIERAILAGDKETGVCVMRMEEALDTGDYCVCRTTGIEDKPAEALSDELANLGSHALLTALVHLERGALDWTRQDEEKASYAPRIRKGELDVNPSDSATQAALKVQASSAAHPSRCILAGRALTLLALATPHTEDGQELAQGLAPGEACFIAKRLFMGMADGPVEVLALKPDGKVRMEAKAFAAGVQGLKAGTVPWKACHA